eukprot:3726766-Rhodomonas_salina.1
MQADCRIAYERQGAQEAEASTSPAGRRRPRKGTPKLSPFDDDSWNDEPEESFRYTSTSDAECCADEDECASPRDLGND